MTELEPVADPISIIARQLTGGIASTCCYKGGWNGGNPQCECRDLAERILETWPAIAEIVTLSSAQSAIAERDARIKALEVDIQGYRDNNDELATAWAAERDRAEAAEALLKEAGKALEPFADCSSEWDGEDDALHVFLEWEDGTPAQSLPVADFRAARAIHHKIGVKDE